MHLTDTIIRKSMTLSDYFIPAHNERNSPMVRREQERQNAADKLRRLLAVEEG